jgi:acid phosphatase
MRSRESTAGRPRSVRLLVEALEARLVPSLLPRPSHVVLVIEENQNYSQIIGAPSAPYINALARQGALITNSFAITHPSQPNYLDLFSGSNQGVTDDSYPHRFTTANLASELNGAGLSFAGYSESLPFVGYTGASFQGLYYAKHNPWVNFTNVPPSENMPFAGYFPADFSQLPTVSIVVPNIADDMHTGTIQQGDAWLQADLNGYARWAQANNSLLIVTWDEDSGINNHIPTIFFGPMVTPGAYDVTMNHFDVLRTLEDMYGLPEAGASAQATPLTYIWQQANERFVQSLYSDFLGRGGSLGEIESWVAGIPQSGRAGVAAAIAHSPEALTRVVDSFYQRFLGRPADASGEQAWVNFLAVGHTEEQLAAAFLSSAEFANQANALIGSPDANTNFVRALYSLLLNRDAGDNEVNFWLNVLAQAGRNGVVAGIFNAPEYRNGAVRTFFGDPSLVPFPFEPYLPNLLKRSAAPPSAEVAHWTSQALDTFRLEVGFAESQEYFDVAQR